MRYSLIIWWKRKEEYVENAMEEIDYSMMSVLERFVVILNDPQDR